MSKPTDKNIAELLKTDSHRAFELIYKTYYNKLCLYASLFFNDKDEVQEIVQKILVKLWDKRDELKNIESICTYLFRSVHNACLNRLRDKANISSISEIERELLELTTDSNEISFIDDKYEMLSQVIEQLPVQCKKVLKMNRIDGFTYKEIAEQLNISHRTVDAHITYAMKVLRNKLNPALIGLITIFLLKH